MLEALFQRSLACLLIAMAATTFDTPESHRRAIEQPRLEEDEEANEEINAVSVDRVFAELPACSSQCWLRGLGARWSEHRLQVVVVLQARVEHALLHLASWYGQWLPGMGNGYKGDPYMYHIKYSGCRALASWMTSTGTTTPSTLAAVSSPPGSCRSSTR